MVIRKTKADIIRDQFPIWVDKVEAGSQVKFVSTIPGKEGIVYAMRKASQQLNDERIFIVQEDTGAVVQLFTKTEDHQMYFFEHLICMEDNQQLNCVLEFECEQSQVSSLFSVISAMIVKWEEQRVYFTVPISKIRAINMFLAGKKERKLEIDIDFAEFNFYH